VSAPHSAAAAGIPLASLPVPDGEYACVVESVELVALPLRGARSGRGVATGSASEPPQARRAVAWVFRVTSGPRAGAAIKNAIHCNTPGQLARLRAELRGLGVARASESRGAAVKVRVWTDGQWRRVSARCAASQSQRNLHETQAHRAA
jgi:hypothetical protein